MRTPTKDGGPAFPETRTHMEPSGSCHFKEVTSYLPGMSLRDWFAGQALAGIMSLDKRVFAVKPAGDAEAELAYALADAMIAAREAKP